jgi:hypothetical protein
MAKKGRKKRSRSRKTGFFSGKLGKILKGGAVGFGIGMIPTLPIVGNFTRPAVLIGGGYFLKDNDLMVMGSYELGRMFSGGTTMSGNGFWES